MKNEDDIKRFSEIKEQCHSSDVFDDQIFLTYHQFDTIIHVYYHREEYRISYGTQGDISHLLIVHRVAYLTILSYTWWHITLTYCTQGGISHILSYTRWHITLTYRT